MSRFLRIRIKEDNLLLRFSFYYIVYYWGEVGMLEEQDGSL